MKNKKRLFVIGICIVLIIVAIIVIPKTNKKQKGNHKESETTEKTVYLSQVLDIEKEQETPLVEVRSSTESANEKYGDLNLTEANARVKLGDIEGKELFSRSDNLYGNIFQAKYTLLDEEAENRIDMYIEEFRTEALMEIGIETEKNPVEETLYIQGDNSLENISSKIYNEKATYCLAYEVDYTPEEYIGTKWEEATTGKIRYEMNFYMKDSNLICELVKLM